MNYKKLLLFPVLSMCLVSCVTIPEVRVSSVNLLTTRTEVSDGAGNRVFAVGYLIVTLTTEVDWVKVAGEHGADPTFGAETCETHIGMMRSYLFPAGKNLYVALIGYKDITSGSYGSYNLASRPEDICMKVGIGLTMNPFNNAKRKIRYALPDNLKDALRVYDAKSGLVEYKLSPDCASNMCAPAYKNKKTQPV